MSPPSGQPAARTRGAGPVVICCASADAGAITSVARDLEAEGHTVEVVAGVDEDPKRLAPVIERCHGEGLYVLCRSRSLSRDTVDALRDVLLARHVPFGRTLTVASTRPRELKERITASMRRVAAGRVRRMTNVPPEGRKAARPRHTTKLGMPIPAPSPPPEKDAFEGEAPTRKRTHTQLGIPVAQVAREISSAKKAAPPDPDTKVQGVQAEVDDEEDSFEDEVPTNTRMRAPKNAAQQAEREARRRASAALDPENPLRKFAEIERQQARRRPTETVELPVKRDFDVSGAPGPGRDDFTLSEDDIVQPRADEASPATASPAPTSSGRKTRTMSPPPPPRARPAAHEDTVGSGQVISPEDLADLNSDLKGGREGNVAGDFAEVPIRSGDTKVQSLKELGLETRSGDTVVVKVDHTRSGNTVKAPPPKSPTLKPALPRPPGLPPPAPTLPVPAQPASSQESVAAPAEPARGRNPLLLPLGLSGAALLLGVLAAILLTGEDDDDAESEDDTIAQVDKEKATTRKSSGGDKADPAPPQDASADEGDAPAAVGTPRTRVGEALRAREVQALDVLLVTTEAEGPFDFSAAEAHCDGLEVAGLSDWRLPDIGELMSLSSAGMTGRGFYWSTTPADTFGDERLVWYARRGRVVTRGARPNLAVCVRGDVGEG